MRQIRRESRAHPFNRKRIAMDEQNLFRCKPLRIGDERFARGMRAELKGVSRTTHLLRRLFGIERNLFALTGISRLRPLSEEVLADLKLALTEAASRCFKDV